MFGYRHGLDDRGRKALHVVTEQAEAIRWAADAVLSGWSLTAIADELTARGYRGAQGARMRTSSVRSFLTSPTIAGRRVHRGDDVGPGNWAAILDMDTWQAVRARLAGARIIRRRDGRDHPVTAALFAANSGRTGRRYLLTGGLAVCGVCGAPLAGCRVNRAGGRCPTCGASRAGAAGRASASRWTRPTPTSAMRCLPSWTSPSSWLRIAADDHAARRDELTAALTALDSDSEPTWPGSGAPGA